MKEGVQGPGKLLFGFFHMVVRDGVLQAQGQGEVCAKAFFYQGIGDLGVIGWAVQKRADAVIEYGIFHIVCLLLIK